MMKAVQLSVDLELPRELLSVASKSKYTAKQRQYKLFGVVYHNGREATKGHYVADVYHTGYATWLHCDDSTVTPTAEQLVSVLQHLPLISLHRHDFNLRMGKFPKLHLFLHHFAYCFLIFPPDYVFF